jgi:hypothetical protein
MPLRKSVRRERRWFRPLRLEPLEQRVLPGFVAPLAFDAGSSPYSVAVGDFNGDGTPDLAVANDVSNGTVSVLLGNGDGTFQAARSFATGTFPNSVAVGDFNRDGTPDLAVADYGDSQGNGGGVSVLLGNGDGTFQAARAFAAGSVPRSVAVGDFNGDGKLDLAVANYVYPNGTVSVLLGNGDGTFQGARSFAAGDLPESVAVGDFNRDGTPDLAVANNGSTVSVLLGNGDGSFQAARNFAAGSSPYSVAVGDFNGDGTPDLAVANAGNVGTVSVLLGNGDGSFQAATSYAAGTVPESVAVGDFNGDGLPDLAVAGFGGVRDLLGNGDGTFLTSRVSYVAGSGTTSVAVGDFNGDGSADLAVANSASNDVSVLLNDNAWPGAPRRPGGQPAGDGRAAAAAVEPRAAPAHALPPAPDVLPTDAGMAVLGSPWAVTMPVPGSSRLPFRVDADPGAAAAAPAPSGAPSPDAVAEAAGFFQDRANVEHLKRDADLEPLRQRDDFRKFIAELEAAAGTHDSERGASAP